MSEKNREYVETSLVRKEHEKESKDSTLKFSTSSDKKISIDSSASRQASIETENTKSYNVIQKDKVLFPDLNYLLLDFLNKAESTLYILIDEWSSLPIDIQPYLAEFLKRGFFSNSKVVIKIASLEYRSSFGISEANNTILGFEIGADISATLDLDDYYVYDRNPKNITEAFSDMLFKHLLSELPQDYIYSEYKIDSKDKLASTMFTNKNVFEELVKASEGVVRDLINIFAISYFDAERRNRASIDKKAVLDAARQWFQQDKSQNLDEELQCVLEKIVGDVIGHRRARSFLLPRKLEKNEVIQRLFDARVLHLMQRGYADKDNPGVRYNIYSLDYGTYVDLINTSKQPQLELSIMTDNSNEEQVVPFNDKRSIRRIILDEDILKNNLNFLGK
jgi:hypothetical protein